MSPRTAQGEAGGAQTARADEHPLWHLPLEGTNLIEASAGTGKTWTISGLYLRLLLERGLAPREILTVTFTIAATAELKTRIRSRLLELRDALAQDRPNGPEASQPNADLEHFAQAVPDRALLRDRLYAGLAGLDEASILTIHGFCQRVLADHAFELGLPFGMQVLEDEEALLHEAASDLWRREIGGADAPWTHYARGRAGDPAALAEPLKLLRGLRHGRVLLPPAAGDSQPAGLLEAYRSAQHLWQRHRVRAVEALCSTPAGRRHGEKWAERIDGYFAAAGPGLDLPATDSVALFETLAKEARASRHPPIQELGAAVVQLSAAVRMTRAHFARRYAEMLVRGARQLDGVLQERKLAEARVSYDDLIGRVRDGLQSAGGERLTAQLRGAYRAALIDEFQDTDRDQYAIFSRVFAGAERPLFLVGDPKQAIYSFRGADIAAYLEARSRSSRHYALLENRRSAAALVEAINHLLGHHANPFMNPDIGFARVAGGTSAALQSRSHVRTAPLQWRWLSGEGRLNKRDGERAAVTWTRNEIARLLGEGARGGLTLLQPDPPPRAVTGSDIAVLTGTHRESELIRTALQQHGIGCTVQTPQSVLSSEEARDMAILMRAVARPGDPRRLKAALTTRLLGETAASIAALDDDVLRWDACLAEFERYGSLARTGGWVAAWQAVLIARKVAHRHLGRVEGPRRLTNLRHLAELIDARVEREGLSLEAVAERLLRGTFDTGTQEQELRLESDEALVRVMTVHGAKGLEFPIVFCPFLWNARAPSRGGRGAEIPLCHDPEGVLVADLGSERLGEHEARSRAEAMEESIRLAYVALTRAQVRCYVACGVFNRCEQAPLAWLLHGSRCEGPALSAMSLLKDRYGADTAARLRAEVYEMAGSSGGTMEVSEHDAADPPAGPALQGWPEAAAPQRFTRSLRARAIASFSSLAALGDPEDPDHDEHLYSTVVAAPGAAAGAVPGDAEIFPRGARAGSCLHALFERVAPSSLLTGGRPDAPAPKLEDLPALRELIAVTLREHGIQARYADAAFGLLCNTVLTRLSPDVPSLARIGEGQRITELAFHARIAAGRPLDPILNTWRRAGSVRVEGSPGLPVLAAGYLKGYIDLVFAHGGRFYIVDYKSNSLTGYGPEDLEGTVVEELYDMQYLLYSAALVQYLRRRLPAYRYEEHFGGVFYLFCRGMRPSSGFDRGIYFARPGQDILEQVAAISALVEGTV